MKVRNKVIKGVKILIKPNQIIHTVRINLKQFNFGKCCHLPENKEDKWETKYPAVHASPPSPPIHPQSLMEVDKTKDSRHHYM